MLGGENSPAAISLLLSNLKPSTALSEQRRRGYTQQSAGKVKKRLRQQPVALQTLTGFRTAVETILQSRIKVLTIAPDLLGTAVILSQQYNLLTNDALPVALMQANGLTRIASHDDDFDRVLGLTRYAPV